MTVVKFDSVYFDNNISPYVKNAKDDLKKAKSKANSLSVPYDYKYRKYLVNLDDKIKGYMDDLDRFNSWVSNCKKNYKDISDKYTEKLEKIEKYSINKHPKI